MSIARSFVEKFFNGSSLSRNTRLGARLMAIGAHSRLHRMLVFCFLLAFSASGQASFGIMPMEVEVQPVRDGARITNDLEAYNGSEEPLHITAKVVDWTLTQTGEYQFSDADTTPQSCAKWIELNPVEFTLPPKKAMRVRYSIATPAGLAKEHRAMIFFQSRPVPTKGSNDIKVMVSTRVGCKIFVQPVQLPPVQGKIADMEVPSTDPNQVRVTFENTGLRNVRIQGSVEAIDAAGQSVAKSVLEPKLAQALPGLQRVLSAHWDKPLAPGDYRVKTLLDFGSKQLVAGELKVNIPPVAASPVAPSPAPDKLPTSAPAPANSASPQTSVTTTQAIATPIITTQPKVG